MDKIEKNDLIIFLRKKQCYYEVINYYLTKLLLGLGTNIFCIQSVNLILLMLKI